MYIGHTNEIGEEQPLCKHLQNTAVLASDNCIDEFKEFCFQIGLLHDIGKYGDDFQRRINGANISVDHSTRGAKAAIDDVFGRSALGYIAAYCIAGHHGGIPDGGTASDISDDITLSGRLRRESADYSAYKTEISPKKVSPDALNTALDKFTTNKDKLEAYAFMVRYFASCLTDADFIDTERFMRTGAERGAKVDFKECLDRVNKRLSSFTPTTLLQKSRAKIQAQAYANANTDADIYLMNMPTGSGKTLCSIKIALEKAVIKGKKHIIYVIPYNSIIDQTVAVLEDMFDGCADVVRHQSTFTYDISDESELTTQNVKRLACENWDAGIIVTTAVQFFESIYSNRSSKLRKLHNMADSIIVFDEAHLMPVSYMAPCIKAVSNITTLLHSKAIFLTATMPDFKALVDKYGSGARVHELITDKQSFVNFKKCEFQNLGVISAEQLCESSQKNRSSLIVVNRKADAVQLYEMLHGCKYHLSTYITGYDRMQTISSIKAAIESGEQVCVVSTSLIEAGVDLDFDAVYRETAGLDNILQTAGRCNREGKKENCVAYVFTLDTNAQKNSDEKQSITKQLLKEFEDITSPQCIESYYTRLYSHKDEEMSQKLISNEASKPTGLPFRTYAEEFNIIDSASYGVVVSTSDESTELINRLHGGDKSVRRKLQLYSASVNISEFKSLLQQGAIKDFGTGLYVLENIDYYSSETGISTTGKDYII